MPSDRFSQRLSQLAELYPNIVPLGRNQFTEMNAKNGSFFQYQKLLEYYEKKEISEFTHKLRMLIKEYPQIVPIDYNQERLEE